MKGRIEKTFKDWPRVKKVIGVILVVYGFVALVTPFTPGAWLIFVGLELLGVELLFWDKIKAWFRKNKFFMKKDMIQQAHREIPKNDEEWKKKLTPEEYRILRDKGTEAPFSGKLLHEKKDGTYNCAACGQALFSSDAKFDSGTGWPSFDQSLPGSVREIPDTSGGMTRTEIVCSRCGSHLGHVFDDLPTGRQAVLRQDGKPAKRRYCLNSVCLDLEEKK